MYFYISFSFYVIGKYILTYLLIDIPKNRLKGVISDIEKKVRSMKDNTISKVIGKRNAIAQVLMLKLQNVIN